MEILKNKAIQLIVIIILTLNFSKAQDLSALQKAFNESYTSEYNLKYSEAIDLLKPFLNDKSYEVNVRLAWLNYLNGDFATSIKQYSNAIKFKPNAIEPKLGIVYPYSYMQNWEAVIAQYIEVLKLDPQNTSVCYKLGSIYYNRLQYTEALPYFEKALNLYPMDYNTMIITAWTYLKLGKNTEAKDLFNTVLMVSANDASAIEGLSYIK